MKVLAEESWTWMLFEHEGALMLSVLCGSIGLYTIEFTLSQEERGLFQEQGEPFVKQLARQVSWQPESFRERRIANFEQLDGLQEATAAWRLEHATAP